MAMEILAAAIALTISFSAMAASLLYPKENARSKEREPAEFKVGFTH